MVTDEQMQRYKYQQTEKGKNALAMADYMKDVYCKELKIPFSEIKTGRLKPLVNEFTGKIERFIEE